MAVGLFDAFDDSAGRKAASDRFGAIKKGNKKAQNALQYGYGQARDDLLEGRDDSYDFLDTGAEDALPYFEKANDAWEPVYDAGMGGVDYYGRLAGLEGGDAAISALDTNPFGMIEAEGREGALDRMERHFAGTGQTGQFALDLASGLSDRRAGALNSALTSLHPYFNLTGAAASGLSGNYGRMAEIVNNLGINKADVAGRFANSLAGNNTDLWSGVAGLKQNTGMAKGNMYAEQNAATNAANKNMWEAIIGGVGAAANAYAGAA